VDRFSFSPLFSPGAVAQVLLKATLLSFLASTPVKKLGRSARVSFGRVRALKENVNDHWASVLWLSLITCRQRPLPFLNAVTIAI